MSKLPDEWRKKRMQDLADKFDGNAPLGRALGYKDGTYVQGHTRTAPNSTTTDNYGTKGNYNPYTGKAGKK